MRVAIRPDLQKLLAELDTASVSHRGLGMSPADDGEYVVHTYDESGQIVALPKEAAAVVAAHVPPPAPVAPDYGDEAPTDFERQAAAVVASLRGYLALSSPTGAQTVAALKVLIRVVLALLRRTL